jgi:hypothetical protein
MKCGAETDHYIGKCSVCGLSVKYTSSSSTEEELVEVPKETALEERQTHLSFEQELICASLSGMRAKVIIDFNPYKLASIAIKDAKIIIDMLEND